MSKHNRTEVIKVLRQQMEAATDPKEKVEFAKQLARLLPKPRQARRTRKLEATPIKAKKGTSSVVAKWADRLSHVEPEGKRIELSVILEVEERRKKGCPEVRTVLTEVIGMLSAEERAVWNSESPEVA
jgi:hypothetical protein